MAFVTYTVHIIPDSVFFNACKVCCIRKESIEKLTDLSANIVASRTLANDLRCILVRGSGNSQVEQMDNKKNKQSTNRLMRNRMLECQSESKLDWLQKVRQISIRSEGKDLGAISNNNTWKRHQELM